MFKKFAFFINDKFWKYEMHQPDLQSIYISLPHRVMGRIKRKFFLFDGFVASKESIFLMCDDKQVSFNLVTKEAFWDDYVPPIKTFWDYVEI